MAAGHLVRAMPPKPIAYPALARLLAEAAISTAAATADRATPGAPLREIENERVDVAGPDKRGEGQGLAEHPFDPDRRESASARRRANRSASWIGGMAVSTMRQV